MRTLYFLIVLTITSITFAQEKNFETNSFPQFVPYFCAEEIKSNQMDSMNLSNYGTEQPARWLSVDPMADKYPGWCPYNYCLNNPLRFTDPNGDTVNIDPQLFKPVVDKNGNSKSWDQMTPEEKQRSGFQDFWNNNGSNINSLFGIGGKYESSTINFNLSTMPYPDRKLSNLFGIFFPRESIYNGYDALTTFGDHNTKSGDNNRGADSFDSKGKLNTNNLEINVWFNPHTYNVHQNTSFHEWKHVSIIFNSVSNNSVIPSGLIQHRMINSNKVPVIK